MDPNLIVILLSGILIVSYLLDMLSKRSNIPTVLMLILLGILLTQGMGHLGLELPSFLDRALEILGIVGLIMIVLEAALDLELSKEKRGIIFSSFAVALFSLLLTSGAIAGLFYFVLIDDPLIALIYAIPLSILSSAIIIPSVGGLPKPKREYMIYDGTFSDILGIMFFYFLIEHVDTDQAGQVAWSISANILLTIALSVLLSIALILFFQKLKSHLKLFLMISSLWLFYAFGKLFHLSSLLIILVFGLILNNHRLFFRGFLKRICDPEAIDHTLKDLRLVTVESAFVIRTFFFVIFGMSISLSSLIDLQVAFISLLVVGVIYLIRFLMLKLFRSGKSFPELWIAPRGLISILLYYGIPERYRSPDFEEGILLYPILISSILMAVALLRSGTRIKAVPGMTVMGSPETAPVHPDGPYPAESGEEEEN